MFLVKLEDKEIEIESVEELHKFSLQILIDFYKAGRYNIGEIDETKLDSYTLANYRKACMLIEKVEYAIAEKSGFIAFKCLTLHEDSWFPRIDVTGEEVNMVYAYTPFPYLQHLLQQC